VEKQVELCMERRNSISAVYSNFGKIQGNSSG